MRKAVGPGLVVVRCRIPQPAQSRLRSGPSAGQDARRPWPPGVDAAGDRPLRSVGAGVRAHQGSPVTGRAACRHPRAAAPERRRAELNWRGRRADTNGLDVTIPQHAHRPGQPTLRAELADRGPVGDGGERSGPASWSTKAAPRMRQERRAQTLSTGSDRGPTRLCLAAEFSLG